MPTRPITCAICVGRLQFLGRRDPREAYVLPARRGRREGHIVYYGGGAHTPLCQAREILAALPDRAPARPTPIHRIAFESPAGLVTIDVLGETRLPQTAAAGSYQARLTDLDRYTRAGIAAWLLEHASADLAVIGDFTAYGPGLETIPFEDPSSDQRWLELVGLA